MRQSMSRALLVLLVNLLAELVVGTSSETATASESMQSLFDSAEGVHLGGSILAMAAIALGIVMVALGYRLFRATLFIVGFACGGTVVALVIEHAFAAESWVVTASWIGLVIGGVFCGLLMLCLLSFGVFAVGAMAGVMLAMILSDAFGYMLYPSDPQLVLVILCMVVGLLGGILALMLEKPVLVVTTSLFGAGLLVWGIGYFAGDFPTFTEIKDYAMQDDDGQWQYSIPGTWCAYLAVFAAFSVLGMAVQFRTTARLRRKHRRTRSAPYLRA